MSRLSILALVLALGCGGKSPSAPTSPLPEEKPAVATPDPTPAPTPEPPPAQPIEVSVEAQPVTVKLVKAGTGKKTPLVYIGKAGDKTMLGLEFDFVEKHTAPAELGGDGENSMPTIIFTAEAETTAADAANIEYTYKVNGGDVRDVPGAKVPAAELKEALKGLDGLSFTGKVGPNGIPTGATKVRVEKGNPIAEQIVNLVQFSMPQWPVLPKEPIGAGAKWQATTTANVVGQVQVTMVTDYELVSRKAGVSVIKGKTKISGTEQKKGNSTISDISGSGTSEATLSDKSLYPQFKASNETNFSVTEQGKAIKLTLKVGGAIGAADLADKAPAAAPAPAKK